MATSSGIDAQVGIAEQATDEDTFATPTRFFELVNESVRLEIDRIPSAGIRAGRLVQHRVQAGAQRVRGTIEQELAPQGLALLIEHWMGDTAATSGVGPYTHTIEPGNVNDLDTLTVQIGRPDKSQTVRAFSYLGCRVTDWEIACRAGEIARARWSIYGRHEDTGQSLATASYPTSYSPFVFTHGTVSVAGSEVEVMEANLRGENGLLTERFRMRTTNPERPETVTVENEGHSYSGALTAEFEDLTDYNRFVNATQAALVLTFNAGASAQLVVTANVLFDGETPQVGGKEQLEQPLPFQILSSTSDAAALSIDVVNSDATP